MTFRKKPAYRRLVLVHCLVPLLAGSSTYVLSGRFDFADTLFPGNDLESNKLATLLINSLADFCWSYSLAMAIYLYSLYFGLAEKFTILLICALLTGSELIQLFLPAAFTFDFYDLAAIMLALVFSYVSYYKISRP